MQVIVKGPSQGLGENGNLFCGNWGALAIISGSWGAALNFGKTDCAIAGFKEHWDNTFKHILFHEHDNVRCNYFNGTREHLSPHPQPPSTRDSVKSYCHKCAAFLNPLWP